MKITAADKRWSLAVRERAGWSCQRCLRFFPEGQRQGLDAHHIFGRACGTCTGYSTLKGKRIPGWRKPHYCKRLDVEMGVSLCTGDHRSWAHAQPLEFHSWARELLGAEVYDELRQRSRMAA